MRAATPSAASPKPCDDRQQATHSRADGIGSYGREEGVVEDMRKWRPGALTGTCGEVLRQLLTGRCVAVHEARKLSRGFPQQTEGRYGRDAKQYVIALRAGCIGASADNWGD